MSLTDNLILLVVTAGLTGVLVPGLKSILDYMKERSQKKVAQQREVLESQAKLLERLAELLWRYWKLALEVAYYAQQTDERGRQYYQDARERYDGELSWEIGRDIHIEVSKARRLIPSLDVYEKLDKLRCIVVDEIDERLTKTEGFSQDGWKDLYRYVNVEVRERVDDALLCVAVDLGLAVPAPADRSGARAEPWPGPPTDPS